MDEFLEVTKAKNGNMEAFESLIRKYQRKLYIIAKARINNEEDIKDIIQNTIIQAYLNIKKLRDSTKFSSWITKILINNCNKVYKSKKYEIVSYELMIEKGGNESTENSRFYENEKDESFFDIIGFLKIEDRTIITLFYLDGYTTKDISKILKINESTIRSRISSIRLKIKKRMGEKYVRDRPTFKGEN